MNKYSFKSVFSLSIFIYFSCFISTIARHSYQSTFLQFCADLHKVESNELKKKCTPTQNLIKSRSDCLKGHNQCRMWRRTETSAQRPFTKFIHEPQQRLWILSLITQTFPAASKLYSFSSFVGCPEVPKEHLLTRCAHFPWKYSNPHSLNVNTP